MTKKDIKKVVKYFKSEILKLRGVITEEELNTIPCISIPPTFSIDQKAYLKDLRINYRKR